MYSRVALALYFLVHRLPSLTQTGAVANEEVGLPLRIFGRGNLCHPYLSLSYIDTLSQPCVRGYIIGNVLLLLTRGGCSKSSNVCVMIFVVVVSPGH